MFSCLPVTGMAASIASSCFTCSCRSYSLFHKLLVIICFWKRGCLAKRTVQYIATRAQNIIIWEFEAAPAWKLHVDQCLEQIGFFNTLIYLRTVNVQVVNELQEVHIKIYTYSNLLSQTLQELLLISK